jgi:hypothetical protein
MGALLIIAMYFIVPYVLFEVLRKMKVKINGLLIFFFILLYWYCVAEYISLNLLKF